MRYQIVRDRVLEMTELPLEKCDIDEFKAINDEIEYLTKQLRLSREILRTHLIKEIVASGKNKVQGNIYQARVSISDGNYSGQRTRTLNFKQIKRNK